MTEENKPSPEDDLEDIPESLPEAEPLHEDTGSMPRDAEIVTGSTGNESVQEEKNEDIPEAIPSDVHDAAPGDPAEAVHDAIPEATPEEKDVATYADMPPAEGVERGEKHAGIAGRSHEKKYRMIGAAVLCLLLILAALSTMGISFSGDDDDFDEASLDEILDAETVRSAAPEGMVVSDESPFYALIATPAACYYDDGGKHAVPLLVEDPETPSTAVLRFREAYAGGTGSFSPGEIGFGGSGENVFDGSVSEISAAVAERYWTHAGTAMIIQDTRSAYNLAVSAVPIASYLNIPVLVTPDVDRVDSTLERLGVEYTFIIGKTSKVGYGDIYPLKSARQIRDLTMEIAGAHLGVEINYIAMANPLDAFEADVLDRIIYDDFSGTVEHSETGSSANPGDSDRNAPRYYFDIPEDYRWARVTVDTWLKVDSMSLADLEGDRIYTYIGTDLDKDGVIIDDADSPDDRLNFMDPSLAYGYVQDENGWWCRGHTFRPMYNAQGEHSAQVLASMPSRQHTDPTPEAEFRCTITVEKLDEPHFPLMPGLSTLAPYLAAYRTGIVLAEPGFSVHADKDYLELRDCGEPDTAMHLLEPANEHVQEVKDVLEELLARLAEHASGSNFGHKTVEELISLADYYEARSIENPMYIGIIGDTNMVPVWIDTTPDHYGYGAYEGFGVSGDTVIYGDIDTDVEILLSENGARDFTGEDPDMELPTGRMGGWDVQDVSALLGRTFFYYSIIDTFSGIYGYDWKESAFAHYGSEPPVESSATVVERFHAMWRDAGFDGMVEDPNLHSEAGGRRQASQYYYENANYHFFCAHGFYYWYVPTAAESLISEAGDIIKGTAGGGAYTVASVKDMNMGPGTIFGSSCVTGKIDGIPGRNALSQAFLHAGMNVYIGASRLSYGSIAPVPDPNSDEALGNYLGAMYYAYMSGGVFYDKIEGNTHLPYEDLSSGQALMFAKNKYVRDKGDQGVDMTTYVEFMHHGDPAFNPYEPNHNG